MEYKVCIPVAGLGSRLGELTRYLNKSLITVANKPIISHIIEKFPKQIEIVIALGYKGQGVRDFLRLAYPDRRFQFVEVFPFEGKGSGLGLSLYSCRTYLQTPFIFCSCDTIVKEEIPLPTENWMGYAELDDVRPYRCIRKNGDQVVRLCEKGNASDVLPYIGLSGIYNYRAFWESMSKNIDKGAIEIGESMGLRDLIQHGITARRFTWFDTGNPEALKVARETLRNEDAPNILDKPNEAIWFIDDKVIKFSSDNKFIANRVKRSKFLEGYCPVVTGVADNMYEYEKVEGKVISEIITVPLFQKLLDHTKPFWKKKTLTDAQQKKFKAVCCNFYKKKTRERVALFYQRFDVQDVAETINDEWVPRMGDLLDQIDWDWLADGVVGCFHGDFHFENILYDKQTDRFCFLDWRQDFGGELEYGDIYYDMAKLNHGIIINHEIINKGLFNVSRQGDTVYFEFHRKQRLVECEHYYKTYLRENGYDFKKVQLMTALIYLNIAALHHYPYCLLLYYFGKSWLHQILGGLSGENRTQP